MNDRHSPRPARHPSGLKARLLSATALVAAGVFAAQPALTADYRYTTAGPHAEAIVVNGDANRIYADVGVDATFGGTLSYINGASGMLEIGVLGMPGGTIVFAPTVINYSQQRSVLRLSGGTVRIGSAIARDFIGSNAAEVQLMSGVTLDVNGANLTLRNASSANAGSRIINDAATAATLIVDANAQDFNIHSTLADGAGTLAVRAQRSGINAVILSGNNTYTGGTTIAAGAALTAASSTALGTGIVRFEGSHAELRLNNGVTLANSMNLASANASAIFNVGAGNSGRLNGAVTAAGFADIFKTGDGELVVGGSMYADRLFINSGTLTSAAGGNIADAASVLVSAGATFNVLGDEKVYDIVGTGTVTLGNGAELTLGRDPVGGTDYETTSSNTITGGGRLVKEGGNRQTLRGANTYSGGTSLAAGMLVAGVSGALGTGGLRIDGAGTVLGLGDNVRLENTVDVDVGDFNVAVDSGTATLAGLIDADGPTAGDFRKSGAGTLILSQSGSRVINAHVEGGTLQVDGALHVDDEVSVVDGAGLAGSGTLRADNVTIANGGTLHGRGDQTLNITGNLALNNTSNIDVALGAASSNALFAVSGNLTLDGRLNITDAGSFGSGVYRLFNYGGTLTNNTLDVNTVPAGTTATVQTSIANQVNVVVAASGGPVLQFWDGGNTSSNNQVEGGSGTWGSLTNWTDSAGSANSAWGGDIAIFQGTAGTVTIAPGGVSAAGLQFVTDGYTLAGAPLTLSQAQTVIRVGDGTDASEFNTATISADITGAGALVKDDYGRLVLTGSNSYRGNTIVRNGTLIGDTDSIRNDVIVSRGLVVFDQAQNGTFSGSITGDRANAGMTKDGAGTLRLTGVNTLDWRIMEGTLISSSDVFRGNVRLRDDTVMRFEQNASGTYGGVVEGGGDGDGHLQIAAGAGNTITFTADSSEFHGTTSVESGGLAVNGALGGELRVLANGRLQGTGALDYVIVNGTIAPGNSIGTLNVENDITFNAGSVFEVEVNAAGLSDRIAAEGVATINGGTVRVQAGAGNYAPQTQYTILTAANGVTGTFAGVTSNFAFLTPSLSYNANNVILTVERNGIGFQSAGITRNQIATAQAVDSIGGGAVYNAVLGLSAEQARYAYDQLSGEIHTSARTVMIEDSQFLRNAVNERLRAAFEGHGGVTTGEDGVPVPADGLGFWSQGFGSWGHVGGDGNAARVGRSIGGIFAGADAQVFDTWRFGAVAGYSHSSFDVKARQSSGSSDNYHVGLYGGTNLGDFAFRTGAAYTWHDVSMSRNARFNGFNETLKSDYDAGTTQIFGELAYGFEMGAARFEPFANLAYVNLHSDGFTESGGAAALRGTSEDTDATFTTLGLRGSTSFDVNGAILTAKGMLGWRHAYGDRTPTADMRFAAGGSVFAVGGAPIARDVAVIEAGLDFALTPSATLGVTYAGQFGSGLADQSFKANLNVRF